MTKTEARAILACQKQVKKSIESCLSKLSPQMRETAEAYWAAHILSTVGGVSYGSMPIERAERALSL
jgi:hypothetical protein